MDYTITNIKNWNIETTIKQLINKRGKKAGTMFANCMLMLTTVANKSSLLDELNDSESIMRIGIESNGKPNIITYGYGCVHQYTFKGNEVHHKTLVNEADFIKFKKLFEA